MADQFDLEIKRINNKIDQLSSIVTQLANALSDNQNRIDRLDQTKLDNAPRSVKDGNISWGVKHDDVKATRQMLIDKNGNFTATTVEGVLEEAAEGGLDYLYKPGISGGQTANGGTGASENLTLDSTAHATKGEIRNNSKTVITINNSSNNTVAYPLRIVHGLV